MLVGYMRVSSESDRHFKEHYTVWGSYYHPWKTRESLLGTQNGGTTHYSAPEIEELIDAANRVYSTNSRKRPALVVLKRKIA